MHNNRKRMIIVARCSKLQAVTAPFLSLPKKYIWIDVQPHLSYLQPKAKQNYAGCIIKGIEPFGGPQKHTHYIYIYTYIYIHNLKKGQLASKWLQQDNHTKVRLRKAHPISQAQETTTVSLDSV